MTRCLLLVGLVALAACNGITAPCDASERPGILLSIVDSASQGPILADSVRVVARDGEYADSLRFTNIRPDPVTDVTLALEREGEYNVSVEATGYRTWERSDIRVEGGRCHVDTVELTATMHLASE